MKLITGDFTTTRDKQRENPKYAKDIEAVRKRLTKAATEVRDATTQAAVALGIYGWIHQAAAYDDSTTITALDLAPALVNHIGDGGVAKTSRSTVEDIARAIETFAGGTDGE